MATYNGEKYIKDLLDSILCQLDKNDEMIVSDDGSTDRTLEIIKSYQDSRIKILNNNKPHSVIHNFENALIHASGDYIFLADQDDVWMHNKVSVAVAALATTDLIVSDCAVVDSDLKCVTPSFFQHNHSQQGFWINLYHNSYVGCCIAFRKEILRMCLPFPQRIPMHDIWLGFVAELFYRSRFIPQRLVLYRRHGGNISSTSQTSPYGAGKKLSFRLNLLRYIPLLLLRKMKLGSSKYKNKHHSCLLQQRDGR
jgi:glycosyltransferase involved in cell wall biosynthesis